MSFFDFASQFIYPRKLRLPLQRFRTTVHRQLRRVRATSRKRCFNLVCTSHALRVYMLRKLAGKARSLQPSLQRTGGFVALFLFSLREGCWGMGALLTLLISRRPGFPPRRASMEVKGVLGPSCGSPAALVSLMVSRLVCSCFFFPPVFLYIFDEGVARVSLLLGCVWAALAC